MDEIAFVKRVLDAMFETYNTRRYETMAITSMQALQLAKVSSGDANRRDSSSTTNNQQIAGSTGQSLTMSQAESMMKRLVEEGWFELSQKGFYSLSPRALIELRGWLVETYNNQDEDVYHANRIKFCSACREMITVVSDILDFYFSSLPPSRPLFSFPPFSMKTFYFSLTR